MKFAITYLATHVARFGVCALTSFMCIIITATVKQLEIIVRMLKESLRYDGSLSNQPCLFFKNSFSSSYSINVDKSSCVLLLFSFVDF